MRHRHTIGPRLLTVLALLIALVVVFDPANAQAQAAGGLFGSGTNFLNALVTLLTATWARLVGIIAVVVTGFLWMTGRLNMGWAISVIGGLILVFGSAAIVDSVQSVI